MQLGYRSTESRYYRIAGLEGIVDVQDSRCIAGVATAGWTGLVGKTRELITSGEEEGHYK